MVNVLRRWWVWPIIAVLVIAIVFTLLPAASSRVDRPLTEFIEDVKAGRVRSVEVDGRMIEYELIGDDQTFQSEMEEGDTVRGVLQDAGIDPEDFPPITVKESPFWASIPGLVFQFLPIIFILAILFFFMRLARGKPGATSRGVDPVCGKRVGSDDSAGSSSFADVVYRFCSYECKQQFDADPVRYLLKG